MENNRRGDGDGSGLLELLELPLDLAFDLAGPVVEVVGEILGGLGELLGGLLSF